LVRYFHQAACFWALRNRSKGGRLPDMIASDLFTLTASMKLLQSHTPFLHLSRFLVVLFEYFILLF
jgi:hypothetical protein